MKGHTCNNSILSTVAHFITVLTIGGKSEYAIINFIFYYAFLFRLKMDRRKHVNIECLSAIYLIAYVGEHRLFN